jgi:hypothetical protein
MNKKSSESTMVIRAPAQRGIPNKIFRAIDEPITSCK